VVINTSNCTPRACWLKQDTDKKLLRQSIRRLNQNVQSLTQVIKDLINKNLISDSGVNDLSACGEGIPFELFQRVASQKIQLLMKKISQ